MSDDAPLNAPLIILGTGLAGYNLAREFRKLDSQRELVLVTADDGRFYSKPLLSTGFAKGKEADELGMQDAPTMAAQLNASVMTGIRVTGIDRINRTLQYAGGQLSYSELVLACGAQARQLPDVTAMGERLLSINDLQDYARFRTALAGKQRVVIIGAGLIGSEFANDLASAGLQVQVVAPDTQLMPGLIPAQVAAPVQAGLEALGVQFHLGRSVVAMQRTDQGLRLTLDDGSQLEAQQGLSAIGLIANTELASAAGIECGRGVKVDRQLRTSDPTIYALGDCAEVQGLNLMYVMPLMTAARSLAQTLAGQAAQITYGPMPVMVKTPACPLVVAPPVTSANGNWTISGSGADIAALFHDAQGVLHGYALTGSAVAQKSELNRQLPAWLV
ncbi:NAD(P)/FAD-dependent oxidoreductase [Halopseudomonas pelagia]|uniref:NAD(P)/FAD-dependent oxidoreductase n=1 Tax=Halopseudomonas pelagia TaxID=553151 RepID=UPI0030D913F6